MNARIIGRRLFTDGATRPVYEDERGQFIEEDGERIDAARKRQPPFPLSRAPLPRSVTTSGRLRGVKATF